jgi:hypothetical protein
MRVRPRGLRVGGAVCPSGRRSIAGAAPGDVHSLFIRTRTASFLSQLVGMTTSSTSGAGGAPAGPPDKFALAKEAYFNQPDGFPFDGFQLEDIVLPPDDDMGIESDDGDVAEEATDNLETGFSSSIGESLLLLSR